MSERISTKPVGAGSGDGSHHDLRTLHAVLRQNLSSFIRKSFLTVSPADGYLPNWHIEAIAWHLEQCLHGEIKRLIITLPPRNLKSISASVAFPAWALGHDPTMRIICASYSNELTAKHARDCRAVMGSDWYRRIFPRTRIDPNKNTELEFMTTRRGFRFGTSVGGTLTGRGGNLIIIDDPMKPSDGMSETKREAANQWFDGTLYSRLDNKATDVIVIIMQRLHVHDLVAHVLEKEDWIVLNIPAIAEINSEYRLGVGRLHHRSVGDALHPEREPHETLDKIKATLGSYNYSAQYQQSPVPAGGGMIKWDWFRSYRDLPPEHPDDQLIQSWDTASTASEISDYSVGTTWLVKGKDCYLLDVVRERLEYPYLKKRIVTEANKHRHATILIENKGSGISLIQDIREDGDERPIRIKPKEDKVTRMHAQSAKIEAGHVLLPERAPWLEDFKTEMLAFPHGIHDDQVDSLSQLLWWVEHGWGNQPSTIKIIGY